MSFAGLMFLGHETLHGAIARGRWNWLRSIVGWICFAPFALSQQLWVVWHKRRTLGSTRGIEGRGSHLQGDMLHDHSPSVPAW